mgnify:CR=1 FL=1
MFALRSLCMALFCSLILGHHAHAQSGASSASQALAAKISNACITNWEDPACMAALSDNVIVLASDYASKLKDVGYGEDVLEALKQGCAAATAANTQEVPAEAMRSAMTECANLIASISEQSGIKPDQSLYQLLTYPILCYEGNSLCSVFELQLDAFSG